MISLTQDDNIIIDYELGSMVSRTVIPETEPLWSHYLHRVIVYRLYMQG